ncbi:DUF3575 domain-containing protein [Bacteroides sedimenti]|uniref:DUF3575 domain-containing protein n=1 Tax=Bacteroides sedimenti TaxID=2136147 RepID=A0ABN6Z1H1_9BACE
MIATALYNNLKRIVLLIVLAIGAASAMAQRIALKTNTLYLATASPNIETEFRMGKHFTLDLSVAGNFSTINGNQLHFQQVSPELRYWFSRPMARHFVGVTTSGTNYNFRFKDHAYDGDALAAGFTYGFDWVISRRWNLETSIGAGMLKYRCFDYKEGEVKPLSPNKDKTIFAPIKLGLTISYILY